MTIILLVILHLVVGFIAAFGYMTYVKVCDVDISTYEDDGTHIYFIIMILWPFLAVVATFFYSVVLAYHLLDKSSNIFVEKIKLVIQKIKEKE